jgi:hypothetical protein
LDAVLENADWELIESKAKNKPLQRANERGSSYKA